jgi:penicillin amidase/acyl-homoserine-lactone acylase
LNLYASRHPGKLSRNLWPARPQDLVAGFVHKLPLFIGLGNEIGRLMNASGECQKQASILNPRQVPIGSNFLAVGPARSADKATRVCINTHQPWTGPVAWYEAHLISEQNNIYGGLFPGSPVILLGHNENIAWGHTVNQPDLVDVFELEVNPRNNNQYKVDGQWLELERGVAPIEVKLARDIRLTVKREMLHSIFGPALRVEDKVYAIRYAGMDQFRQLEQWYKMGQAKNLSEFKQAMRIQALSMFNTGYGDRDGNIFHVYNALIPKRIPGHDWSGILKGNSRDLIWDEYLSFDELPQVENPAAGFLQNCNSNPFKTTLGQDNPDESKFKKSHGIEKWMTNRARRALELFGKDDSITREEFFRYKYDKTYGPDSNLRIIIKDFLECVEISNGELQEELALLGQWDGSLEKTNRSAAITLLTFRPRSNTQKLKSDHQRTLQRLRETSVSLRKNFGRIDVEWGKVNRLIRGDKSFPLGGGSDTLRAIYGEPQENGIIRGVAGDCFVHFVEWDESGKLQAWATHQFGSATADPKSPHFNDQSPLFSQEKTRKTLFTREEVLAKAKNIYQP